MPKKYISGDIQGQSMEVTAILNLCKLGKLNMADFEYAILQGQNNIFMKEKKMQFVLLKKLFLIDQLS